MLPAGYLMGGQGNVPRQVRRKRPLLPLHHLRFYARDLGFSSNEGDASIPSSLHTAPAPTREARGNKGIIQCASRYAFTTVPIPASERGEGMSAFEIAPHDLTHLFVSTSYNHRGSQKRTVLLGFFGKVLFLAQQGYSICIGGCFVPL